MVEKITEVLKENGFSEIKLDYQEENKYFFDAYSDDHQEVRVDVDEEKNQISVFDRYLEEKHFCHFGDFLIPA